MDFKPGFYIITENYHDLPDANINVLLIPLKVEPNHGLYDKTHKPWLLGVVLTQYLYDYEKYTEVSWLDCDNLRERLIGFKRTLDDKHEINSSPSLLYCVYSEPIIIPENELNNHNLTYRDDFDIDQYTFIINKSVTVEQLEEYDFKGTNWSEPRSL